MDEFDGRVLICFFGGFLALDVFITESTNHYQRARTVLRLCGENVFFLHKKPFCSNHPT